MSIAAHIGQVTSAGAEHVAIDLDGATLRWSSLKQAIAACSSLFASARLPAENIIGLLGRNSLEAVGGFIALLGAERGVTLINALRPAGLIAEELAELKIACVMGARGDLSPDIVAAAKAAGTMVVAIETREHSLTFDVISALGTGPFRVREAGTLIEIQTSGTTGKPKRIPISERTMAASLQQGVRTAAGVVEQAELKLKSSPTLMFGPLVHTSGTFNTLMSVFEVRPIVLFEKFDVAKYLAALERYRPKFAALPPPAIKMIMDSDAKRESFAGVIAVRAGTAALPVDLQIAFEDRFGVPVLTTYGATEFMGIVASWTLEDYRKFGKEKRGSVGRASPGATLRVVDPNSGEPVSAEASGLLEVKLARIDDGAKWHRTTDLARIDADGFLYILGRTDDAIIRGGFKIMASKVTDVLLNCPGVRDAIVLGRPDERLGEVPVAVVEAVNGSGSLHAEELKAFAKQRLTPYEVPARFFVIERLPRTVSDKVSRHEVAKWLAAQGS